MQTDQRDRLTAALAGRYVIERELGSGGMAPVYLAHDVKHHREVALKVLRPELAAALGPDRILREAEHGEAMGADFGIALAVSAAAGVRLTQTGLAVGTPAYMSPEQAVSERALDARSDVYSLGCVLYEMLAGEPPYTGATAQVLIAKRLVDPVPAVRRLRAAVPVGVEQALTKALAKVPADRWASALAFAEALATPA